MRHTDLLALLTLLTPLGLGGVGCSPSPSPAAGAPPASPITASTVAPTVGAASTPAPAPACASTRAVGDADQAELPKSPALHTVDLMTTAGVDTFGAKWRYSDVEITSVDFVDADEQGQPGTTPNRAYDIEPRAGAVDFDDRGWEVIDPSTLDERRTAGKVSFNWYRITLTIPETIGDFEPTGSTAVLELSVDDYAEIWVDGELPRRFGQRGGSVISGWNSGNRLVIGRDLKPGQEIQIAVFGINGPISQAPTNYIYVRTARVEFHRGGWEPQAVEPQEVNVRFERKHDGFDSIVPTNPKIFKVADGFTFTEGPVWLGDRLLFSDPNDNRIYAYHEDGRLRVFRDSSGYTGADIARYHQPGSNGLALDPQGRLTVCEHGNRRVTRTEPDGSLTVLADRFEGKRLNSPNDLVYRTDGTLYFTDPPFGLPKAFDDPGKELPHSGVYRLTSQGELSLESSELSGPNGLALSPGETFLYVGNWDPERKVVMRHPVQTDGSLGPGTVFFDMTAHGPKQEAIDGLEVDTAGNIYVSGPGGLWILSPEAEHLGTVTAPRPIHNIAWGGDDAKTLYLTAESGLYRMPLRIPGAAR